MENLPRSIQNAIDQTDFEDDFINTIDNPVVKTLAAFASGVPLVAAPLIEIVIGTWHNMSRQKSNIFFRELNNNPDLLNEGLLRSEEFIHKFMITYKAVIFTRRNEKIKFFANLLVSSVNIKDLDIDKFEDYLIELDRLSYKQIVALVLLDEYYSKISAKPVYEYTNEERLKLFKEFKDDVHKKIAEFANLNNNDVDSFLVALSNSRCYQKLDYFGVNHGCGDGFPTEFYYKLKQYAYLS